MSWEEELQNEFDWNENTEPSLDVVIKQAKDHGFDSASELVDKMEDAPSDTCPTGSEKWKWFREYAKSFGFD
jgi:hypothetical protein